MDLPKEERFKEFLHRLDEAPAAGSFGDAYKLLCDVLNAVEDELTTLPFDPENWVTDGRMYPPQMDSIRDVEGQANVKRFRSRAHNTFVADNGAIEIQEVRGAVVVFRKDGMDGRGVWQK